MTLSDYMAAHGLRDHDVAAACGCDRAHINRIRRGEMKPSWQLAAKLHAFTAGAVTANDFLDLPTGSEAA